MLLEQKIANQAKKILIVENDDATGELLVMAITQETPFQVLHTTSAREAFNLARIHVPDLFLLDYHLSSMTGLQLYDQLHALLDLEHIPAILMSASLERYEEELKARNLRGIVKPFELTDFLSTLEDVLL